MLRHLHDRYPIAFRERFGATEAKCSGFWNNYCAGPVGQARVANHPLLKNFEGNNWRRHMVPLAIHEDAGPYAKASSCVGFSFSGVLGQGDEKVSQIPIASCIKKNLRTKMSKISGVTSSMILRGHSIKGVGISDLYFSSPSPTWKLDKTAGAWSPTAVVARCVPSAWRTVASDLTRIAGQGAHGEGRCRCREPSISRVVNNPCTRCSPQDFATAQNSYPWTRCTW